VRAPSQRGGTIFSVTATGSRKGERLRGDRNKISAFQKESHVPFKEYSLLNRRFEYSPKGGEGRVNCTYRCQGPCFTCFEKKKKR